MHIYSHPGEILKMLMQDDGVSARVLATAIDVPTNRITEIVRGVRGFQPTPQ